jgi:hypothetical protein
MISNCSQPARWLRRLRPVKLLRVLSALLALTAISASAVTETFDSYANGTVLTTVGGGIVWTPATALYTVASTGGVNGSAGIGTDISGSQILNWKAQPFQWSTLAVGTKVAMSLDFQTAASGNKFDDDRVGWTVNADSSTSSANQFALQLDVAGMECYWDSNRTPLNALAGIKFSTWYRFRVEYTKLTATSAGIVGTLTELDAAGNPTGTPYVGTIADSSAAPYSAPTGRFTSVSQWPSFKNYNAASGNADNATFNITVPTLLSESFDSMGSAGTTLPAAWTAGYLGTVGTQNRLAMSPYAGNGQSITAMPVVVNAGGMPSPDVGTVLNLGSAGSSDRALGNYPRTNPSGDQIMQVAIVNTTGGSLASIDVSYAGEQWRQAQGTSSSGPEMLRFLASTTSPTTGFTYFPGLDFTAPKQGAANIALDGNLAANRAVITGTITLPGAVPAGGTFYLRWHDWNDNSTTDHFLAIDDLTVTRGSGPLPPTVAITSPANNASVSSNFTITATAAASVGSVTNVSFYDGSTLLGSDTTSPYSYDWNGAPAGAHVLKAVAWDSTGLAATSAVVNVTVATYRSYTGAPITENFNGLGTGGTSITLLTGWDAGHFGTNPQQGTTGGEGLATVTDPLVVDDGSHDPNGTPMLANFGTTGAADRALGSFARTTPAGDQFLQLAIKNDSGSAITSFSLSYRGEEWRSANVAVQQLTVWYSGTSATSGFVSMSAFTFSSPNNTGNNVAIDGNAAGNFTVISGTYTPASPIAPGSTFYLRWYDINDNGIADDFLAIDDLTVTPTLPPQPPTVSVTNPVNNATVGTSFTISATAADSDGTVTNVSFYDGSTLLGSDTTSPYSYAWSGAPLGAHLLKAVAFDNTGLTATSTVVNVTVSAPVVIFTAYNDCSSSAGTPANTTEYRGNGTTSGLLKNFDTGATLPVTLTITANAVSYDGTGGPMPNSGTDAYNTFNGKVVFDDVIWYTAAFNGFWMDATFTGLDPAKEYEFATSVNRGGSGGDYGSRFSKFTISGIDFATNASTAGVTVNSNTSVTFCSGSNSVSGFVARWTKIKCGADGAFTVRVEDGGGVGKGYAMDGVMLRESGLVAPQPPTVSITSPLNNATVGTGFTITANATDNDGTVTNVSFYDGSTLLGSDTTSPYSYTWSSAPLGAHVLKAVAWDNTGLAATSAVVNVTVAAPAAGFTAYNDCTASAGNPANTTLYRGQNPGDMSGFMKDFATGATLPVTLAVSSANVNYGGAGGPMPDVGTDAYNTFNGKVVFNDVAYYGTGWWMEARFTGLDPAKEYEFATSVNRGGSGGDYGSRLSKFTISGVDSATNSSTSGVTVNSNTSVTFCTGINGVTGYVARWTKIKCGADGIFTVRVEDGGSTVLKGYAFDGVMLRESVPQPPTVSITSPANNATVSTSFTISATAAASGGSVTNVSFYDGGTLLGSDSTSPYSYTWSPATLGSHALTAVAWDSTGLAATSAVVNVTVASYRSYTSAPIAENFDGLGASGTVLTPLIGWNAGQFNPVQANQPGPGNSIATVTATSLLVDDGTIFLQNNTAKIGNLGTTGSSDRALGGMPKTASGDMFHQLAIKNDSGRLIKSFVLSYTGEQWASAPSANPDSLTVWFSDNNPTNGFVTMGSGFTFTAPQVNLNTKLDGNAAANRTAISGTFTPAVPIAAGNTFYLRWYDRNDAAQDHVLALDDLTVTPTIIPQKAQYAIVISVDGLGGTYLKKIFDGTATGGSYLIPNFRRLKNEGASTLAAHCDNNNWETLPNHTSIVTARPRDGTAGHGWTGNGDPAVGQTIHSVKGSYVAGVFDVTHDNGLRTGMYANKTKFSLFDTYGSYTGGGSYNATYGALDITGVDNGRDKVDNTYVNTTLGGIIVDTFINQQKSASPNQYGFLHINEPDAYGHSSGWGTATWNSQVVVVDTMLGKIFKLIEQDVPAMKGNTVIILTADHGNQDNPSTGADRYQVPFFVWGPGVAAGADLYVLNASARKVASIYPMTTYTGLQPVRNAEVNNLALQLLGLGPIPGSMFDFAQDLVVVAPPPTAPNLTLGALSGVPVTMQIIGGKKPPTDPSGYALAVSAVAASVNATVTTDGSRVTYTANSTYIGPDTFTYTVTNTVGGSATATVAVTVAANGQRFNLLSGPVNNGDGTSTINIVGLPGYRYALETTASLALPIAWTPVVTNTTGPHGQASFTFSNSVGQAFFRTRWVP